MIFIAFEPIIAMLIAHINLLLFPKASTLLWVIKINPKILRERNNSKKHLLVILFRLYLSFFIDFCSQFCYFTCTLQIWRPSFPFVICPRLTDCFKNHYQLVFTSPSPSSLGYFLLSQRWLRLGGIRTYFWIKLHSNFTKAKAKAIKYFSIKRWRKFG